MSHDGSPDDAHAPSHQVRHGERVPVAQGILSERHGISTPDAVILLSAMTTARGVTALRLATQIIADAGAVQQFQVDGPRPLADDGDV